VQSARTANVVFQSEIDSSVATIERDERDKDISYDIQDYENRNNGDNNENNMPMEF